MLLPCWMKPSYQLLSGLWLSLLMFMCGTGSLLHPYQVQLPIHSGSSENQTFLTSGCLGALPMSISSEISKNLCSLTRKKCIFVGYPSGYKGWQFYNPVTKKFIISERAIFDERSFPGLSQDITSWANTGWWSYEHSWCTRFWRG